MKQDNESSGAIPSGRAADASHSSQQADRQAVSTVGGIPIAATLADQVKRDEAAFDALSPVMQKSVLNELRAIWPAMAERAAQAIDARRAATGTGAIHESAVAKPCAQPPSSPPEEPFK